MNEKFAQIIKNHKIMKSVVEISQNTSLEPELRKTCVRIVKNLNGGKDGKILSKIKANYLSPVFGVSSVNGFGT